MNFAQLKALTDETEILKKKLAVALEALNKIIYKIEISKVPTRGDSPIYLNTNELIFLMRLHETVKRALKEIEEMK